MSPPADTASSARAAQMTAYRAMSPSDRVRATLEMSAAARDLSIAGHRARHPDWSETQVQRAVAELLLGPDLANRAFTALTR
jgi:hypothetical protein